AHPYLTVGTDRIDENLLSAPGATWLPTDDRAIPTGRESVDATPYDFRRPCPIGATKLDTAYTDLERGADGTARVVLRSADGTRAAALWMDETYPYLMLFTGDPLPDPARRRRSLGIEPMTCAPNALQTGDGLRVLDPGEQFTSTWGIRPEVAPSSPEERS
ncbi:MAG: aldose 1-epimerase family protein, partial [Candidatus Dormibacteraceae bacterium]